MIQKEIGESCVLDDECNLQSVCDNGVCVGYFSLGSHNYTTNANGFGFSYTCESGWSVPFNTTHYSCMPLEKAPKSPKTGPKPCNIGDLCPPAQTGAGYDSKPCTCGLNNNGTAYCPLFEGDAQLQDAISNWKAIVDDYDHCNTISRWDAGCFQGYNGYFPDEYFYFKGNLSEYLNWPLIVDADECAMEVYLHDHWYLM